MVRTFPKGVEVNVLGRQMLRSATSIAANLEEAQARFSKEDFTSKMNLAFKESRETHLWLRLIRDSEFLSGRKVERLLGGAVEIRNILGTIVSRSKTKKS